MPTPRRVYGYGWVRDIPDRDDLQYRLVAPVAPQPSAGNLNPQWLPPVFNQGRLGSCTGASSSRATMYLIAKEQQPFHEMSALFAYWNARFLEGNEKNDSGAQIRDVVKGIIKYGLCADSLWPYDITKFAIRPSERAFKDAHFTVLESYERIVETGDARIQAAKQAILDGWPIIFGFVVYQFFETELMAQEGVLRMPRPGENIKGGHAVWNWAYDDSRGAVRIRNSWGSEWGIGGDFWMPYGYFADPHLVSDIWVLKTVS